MYLLIYCLLPWKLSVVYSFQLIKFKELSCQMEVESVSETSKVIPKCCQINGEFGGFWLP